MYKEFCRLARKVARANHHYGLQCLFRFYSYGLEARFRTAIYRDFEEYALRDYESGSLYGLEKFWLSILLEPRETNHERRLERDHGKKVQNVGGL